jgi:flavin reductase (DIM6/NTAB) family NADH-FMN oxidoreductase RutF
MQPPDEARETLDAGVYRQAIANFATGVTVITTMDEGRPAGMTASAVCSLSLDPIMLLVCISNHLPTHGAIERSASFVVNVLGEGDGELALHFARPAPDKFAGIDLEPGHALPVLARAIAHFVCDVGACHPGGDHSIFLGRVRSCAAKPGRRPLIYFGSAFGALRDRRADLLAESRGWDVAGLGGFGSFGVIEGDA